MTQYKVYTVESGLVETDDYVEVILLTWHRLDGPAFIEYRENGNIRYESYWINGKLHRLNGPAVIRYNMNGSIQYIEYWLNGIEYTKENYHKELLKLKVQSL